MNSTEELHTNDKEHRFGDTCITACKHYGKRLLGFGAAIHLDGYYLGSIVGNVDDDVVKQMK